MADNIFIFVGNKKIAHRKMMSIDFENRVITYAGEFGEEKIEFEDVEWLVIKTEIPVTVSKF